MGMIFKKKYDNFYPYYQSMIDNKTNIENQIDLQFNGLDIEIELDIPVRDIFDHESISIHDLDSPAQSER